MNLNDLKTYLSDGWSWVHFAGGWLGLLNFYFVLPGHWIDRLLFAGLITVLIDFTKEILDTVTSKSVFWRGRFGFDARGGDTKDVLMCVLGIITGTLILIFVY